MENQNNTLIINTYLFNFNSEMILSLFNSISEHSCNTLKNRVFLFNSNSEKQIV